MKRVLICSTFIFTLFLTGCFGPRMGHVNHEYQPPTVQHVKNKKIVNQKFDKAWNMLVATLSESYFVINNIDKESHIINITYPSNMADSYVDCGTDYWTTWRNGRPQTNFTYPYAQSKSYTLEGGIVSNFEVKNKIRSQVHMESRINLYLAPIEKHKTMYIVNVQYTLKNSTSNTPRWVHWVDKNNYQQQPASLENYTDTFSTNAEYTRMVDLFNNSYRMQCGTKGTLEQKLLNLLN